jgi:RNA polymerase sigma factor (sigma-70 family)
MIADDRELLRRFASRHEGEAFEALLQRHGAMVLGVCRRMLRDSHATEDAFQATFLVLAQKAMHIRHPEALGGWLYSVATRIAVKLRHSSDRGKTMTATPPAGTSPADPIALVAAREIQDVLDEELQQLPQKYRTPLVLCYLEGKSTAEAARVLQWPASSLTSRVQKALDLLRQRLSQRGVVLSTPLLATALAEQSQAAVSTALAQSTARTASLIGLGQASAVEESSATALALAQGVLHAMRMTQLKMMVGVLLALTTLTALAGIGLHSAVSGPGLLSPASNPSADKQPPAKAVPPAVNPPDPLEAFRQALKEGGEDKGIDPKVLEYRKANLQKRAQDLRRIGDLREALALEGWRDKDKDKDVAAIDGPVRKEMIERFTRDLRKALDKGDQPTQLAALSVIGEVGIAIQGETEKSTVTTDLIPDVVRLVRGPAGPVREAAARTLGKINLEPKEAPNALGELLINGDVAGRRAAAEGLASSLRIVLSKATSRSAARTVELDRPELLVMAEQGTRMASFGLHDEDAVVRRFCLEAMQAAAPLLAELGEVRSRDLPAPGRPFSDEDQRRIDQYLTEVATATKEIRPLAQAVNAVVDGMAKSLDAKDHAVCLAACEALEEIANARLRLLPQAQAVVLYAKAPKQKTPEDLLDQVRVAVPGLIALLSHKDVRIRLAAIYALETMETEAASAAEAIAKCLDDANPFVRWGAARALGKMAPKGATAAVPALAKHLEDENNDVRVTAIAALERFGPAATEAVPLLVGELNRTKDVAMQQQLIRALSAMGKEAGQAVPALITALKDSDQQVRVAAARALGKLGATAKPARPALLETLKDKDAEVRQAAAEALLAIPQ